MSCHTTPNNGQGTGSRLQATSTTTTQTGGAAPAHTGISPFTAALQGTVSESQPDASGAMTIQVTSTLSNGAQGTLQVLIQGQLMAGGSVAVSGTQVTLTPTGAATSYQGQTSDFQSGTGEWRIGATLQPEQGQAPAVKVSIRLQQSGGNQLQGTIDVSAA